MRGKRFIKWGLVAVGAILIILTVNYYKPIPINREYPAVFYKDEKMNDSITVHLDIVLKRKLFSKDKIDGSLTIGERTYVVSNYASFYGDSKVLRTGTSSLLQIIKEKLNEKYYTFDHVELGSGLSKTIQVRVDLTKDHHYLLGMFVDEESDEMWSFIAPAESYDDVPNISKIWIDEYF